MARLESQDNPTIINALLSGKLLALSSLARVTEIPTTTLYRRLRALTDMGIVSYYQPAGAYCLSQWLRTQDLGFRTASEIISERNPHQKPFRIFTVGYEGRTPGAFLQILQSHNVKRLVDVRQIANSRKTGFSSGALQDFLKKHGIEYVHLERLGSSQIDRQRLRADNDFASFSARYRKTLDSRKNDLSLLIGLAIEKTTAMMCFELDPQKCHRSIIASRIQEVGFEVNNL